MKGMNLDMVFVSLLRIHPSRSLQILSHYQTDLAHCPDVIGLFIWGNICVSFKPKKHLFKKAKLQLSVWWINKDSNNEKKIWVYIYRYKDMGISDQSAVFAIFFLFHKGDVNTNGQGYKHFKIQ